MPFCNTPKKSQSSSSTSLSFQTTMFLFLRELCGLFRPLPWSEFFHRENRKAKKELSLSLSPPLYFLSHLLSYLSLLYLLFLSLDTNPLPLLPVYLSFVFISITAHPFSCFPSLSLCTKYYPHIEIYILIIPSSSRSQLFAQGATFILRDLMSKKSKGVFLDSAAPYGIGVYEDTKARLKYQTLLQDYEELQKEADVMNRKLEASKQRKLMLAAEVRFLRRRFEYLVKTKNTNSFKERSPVEAPSLLKRAKITKEQVLIGKEAGLKKKQAPLCDAFPVSDQPRKKKTYGGKEAKGHSLSLISTQVSDLNHKRIKHTRKEAVAPNTTPISDRERMFGASDAAVRNSTAAFDLNQDTAPSEREAPLPTRAPIFDLNEISTGDEDFGGSVELEEARKSLMRGMNEEQQNDVKLSVCRNAGESSSRGGKRKISWQDPVALRV